MPSIRSARAASAARAPRRRGRHRRAIGPSSRSTRGSSSAGRSTRRSTRSGSGLAGHRRRLWMRRIVRRAWLALAAIAVAEAGLLGLARLVPIEILPTLVVAIAIVGDRASGSRASVRARPSLGETAVAVDGEGHLGDRVVERPVPRGRLSRHSPGPAELRAESTTTTRSTDAAEAERFVRRQRLDAVGAAARRSRRTCSGRGCRAGRRRSPSSRRS